MLSFHPLFSILFWIGILTASAKFKFIPFGGTTVPITLQTLVIHLLSYYELPLVAITAITSYVGFITLLHIPLGASVGKNTYGYLFGFTFAITISSILLHSSIFTFGNNLLLKRFGVFILADATILVCGASFYYFRTGIGFQHSVYPFLIGDLVKCLTALFVTAILWGKNFLFKTLQLWYP